MFVADPPAIVAPSDENPLDVIEVVGSRPGQAQKIDRRAYRVKQNPQSAQFNGIQLLRGLPAVTITPDDQIMLLGAPGVTILVDERPVQGDPILYLRTLHGSDIERIEIMTNPSAQYASGTGGIINIVLRKKQEDGISGSANVEVASRGRVESGTTIKKKKGKWTYELQAQGKAGRTSSSTYRKLRAIQQVEGGPSTDQPRGRWRTFVAEPHVLRRQGYLRHRPSHEPDCRRIRGDRKQSEPGARRLHRPDTRFRILFASDRGPTSK